MIEVHNNPAKAKCDGAQSLTPDQFDELMQFIGKEVEFFGKKLTDDLKDPPLRSGYIQRKEYF